VRFSIALAAKTLYISSTPLTARHAKTRRRSLSEELLAEVAELADAHDSGSCGRQPVEVQVLSSALKKINTLEEI
jgi:hypothetical protein